MRKWRGYRDNMTLEDASEASGLSVATISALERGEQGYSDNSLKALAKAYNVPRGYLLDVDPFEATDILDLWGRADGAQKGIIMKIARGVLAPEED